MQHINCNWGSLKKKRRNKVFRYLFTHLKCTEMFNEIAVTLLVWLNTGLLPMGHHLLSHILDLLTLHLNRSNARNATQSNFMLL